ncbi:hypothetical protein RSal33209_0976 [Renibacterium salmoninarum ATCC 33209]|uniref:Uncharacterized protein n=1 Tax=Renibacterium salmoninarum (strain ATCC 33209 / DSM 20767 / JCM 11484 / NBRC 15589 / NCIMB 2235) TaxID=288705 RepID=A9WNJ5_RENSM|nr:DUF3995 domain-containing protein [Renibacterium salmoninarum]ABY22717.1 hypothetical protein RSal33209_0976 [Renibacterium salmoninarum ATCC 33209]
MTTETNAIKAPEVRPVRIGTLGWGLLLIALAALIVVARYTAVELDPRLVAIVTLLVAGLLLLLGGAFSALSKRRRKVPTDAVENDTAVDDALLNDRNE